MAKFSDLNLLSVGNTIQIVGAIWAGEGKMFLCMFPGEHGDIEDVEGNDVTAFVTTDDNETVYAEALNMTLEEWQVFIHQTDVLDMEGLVQTPEGKVVKAIIRKSERQIAQGVSWAVYKRDGYKCAYCSRDDVPLTVDHLVLFEEGGPSTEANLLSSCRKCNKTRGNAQYADWLKHPYYRKVSQGLTPERRAANEALVATLDAIPRTVHQPTKRK